MGDNADILWTATAVALALTRGLAEVIRDLKWRRYHQYTSLRRAIGVLESGDARSALRLFRLASQFAAREGDLAAFGAAWHGIARAREMLGDTQGSAAADATAADAAYQANGANFGKP